jgi:ATP-dependent RNA helicase DeaD
MDVAAAAVKQADSNEAGQDEEEIPTVSRAPGAARGPRDAGKPVTAGRAATSAEAPAARPRPPTERRARLRRRRRKSKIRPADLVGAIVNEAGIDPRVIGAIQITDRFSLVELPDDIADDVIGTLRATTIKGRKCWCGATASTGA